MRIPTRGLERCFMGFGYSSQRDIGWHASIHTCEYLRVPISLRHPSLMPHHQPQTQRRALGPLKHISGLAFTTSHDPLVTLLLPPYNIHPPAYQPPRNKMHVLTIVSALATLGAAGPVAVAVEPRDSCAREIAERAFGKIGW